MCQRLLSEGVRGLGTSTASQYIVHFKSYGETFIKQILAAVIATLFFASTLTVLATDEAKPAEKPAKTAKKHKKAMKKEEASPAAAATPANPAAPAAPTKK